MLLQCTGICWKKYRGKLWGGRDRENGEAIPFESPPPPHHGPRRLCNDNPQTAAGQCLAPPPPPPPPAIFYIKTTPPPKKKKKKTEGERHKLGEHVTPDLGTHTHTLTHTHTHTHTLTHSHTHTHTHTNASRPIAQMRHKNVNQLHMIQLQRKPANKTHPCLTLVEQPYMTQNKENQQTRHIYVGQLCDSLT